MFGDGKARYVYTKHWTRLKWQAIRLWTWKSRDSRLLLSVELHIQMLHTKRFSVFHENCAERRKRIKTAESKKKNHKLQQGERNHSISHRNYASFFYVFILFVRFREMANLWSIMNIEKSLLHRLWTSFVKRHRERAYSNHVFQFAHFTHCTILTSYSPESRAFPTNRSAAVILCVRCRPSTEMWERSTFAVYMVLNSTKSSSLPHEIWVNFLLPTQWARAIYKLKWLDSI